MAGQTVQTQIRLLQLWGGVWSGSTLFAIPSASFGLITLWQSHIVQILEWLQQFFWVSEYLGNLRYYRRLPRVNEIYKYIKRLLLGSKNGKKKFKRTEKINKIWDQQTLFMFILSNQIIILFPADTFSR